MTIDDNINDEKLQYDKQISSNNLIIIIWKTDKYEYLIGEEIVLSDQNRIIE